MDKGAILGYYKNRVINIIKKKFIYLENKQMEVENLLMQRRDYQKANWWMF